MNVTQELALREEQTKVLLNDAFAYIFDPDPTIRELILDRIAEWFESESYYEQLRKDLEEQMYTLEQA